MADHVQEQVRGDAVQPPLERARLVALQRAEHAHERFLREILRIVRIAREAEGQAVDAVAMLLHELRPRGHVPLARVEGRRAGKILGPLMPGNLERGGGIGIGRVTRVERCVDACAGRAFVVHGRYLALFTWGSIHLNLIVPCEYSSNSATNHPGCT